MGINYESLWKKLGHHPFNKLEENIMEYCIITCQILYNISKEPFIIIVVEYIHGIFCADILIACITLTFVLPL